MKAKTWIVMAVIVLIAVQVLQIVIVLHRESLTWDEEDHMYAGYRMWKARRLWTESRASAAREAAGHTAGAGRQALDASAEGDPVQGRGVPRRSRLARSTTTAGASGWSFA